MDHYDAIVLGAGPAGLGAGLALARGGARVAIVDAAERVGGLCRTRERDGLAYDIGGHALFVRDARREAWLRDLLGDDLVWVPRPVACVRGGRITPGRYLDQRPGGVSAAPAPPPRPDEGGADYLARVVAPEHRDAVMRPYLEKVDRMALEEIPALRVGKLLIGQAAPTGFLFPGRGIGQLMDAMAAGAGALGASVVTRARVACVRPEPGGLSVDVVTGHGERRMSSDRLVVAIPAALAASLVDAPGRPPAAGRARAVALVYLEVPRSRLTDESWIQIDDPTVPFARLFEPANWSAALAREGRSAVCCECYFDPADAAWAVSDEALVAACAGALADPLGWLADGERVRGIEVVRLPRAYTLSPLSEQADAWAPARWLSEIPGLALAQGGAVIEAIEAGERAAG